MRQKQTILITGGLGYIGAPTAHALAKKGYQVVVFDIRHSSQDCLYENIYYVTGDIRKKEDLKRVFSLYHPYGVIHLAALTSVIDSQKNAKLYKETNVMGTKNVCEVMELFGCHKLLFASSASVYGETNNPVKEDHAIYPTSCYGKTKVKAEEIIGKNRTINSVIVRYFNVVGTTKDGVYGESIRTNPKLIPSVLRVGLDEEKQLIVYGNTYPTPDGSAIRDYVSLEDVVEANIRAIDYFQKNNQSIVCNIGSGVGTSNMDIVHAVEKQCEKKIPIIFQKPRKEIMVSIAHRGYAKNKLGWEPKNSTIPEIIRGLICFQKTLR